MNLSKPSTINSYEAKERRAKRLALAPLFSKLFTVGSDILSYVSFGWQVESVITDSKAAEESKQNIEKMYEDLKKIEQNRMNISSYITDVKKNLHKNYDEIIENHHKIEKVEEKVDRNFVMLKGLTKEIKSINASIKKLDKKMSKSFRETLNSIRDSRIQPIISELNTTISSFENDIEVIKLCSPMERVSKLEENNNILERIKKSRVAECNSLHILLYNIINQNFAIPENASDVTALNALSALHYGTLTYVSLMLFLLEQYLFLSNHYYKKSNLEKFNNIYSLTKSSYCDFKTSLVGKKGLLLYVMIVLENAKKKVKNSDEISETLSERIKLLNQVENQLEEMQLPLIDDEPEKLDRKSFNFGEWSVSTPIGKWVPGAEVRYAIQLLDNGAYSKIGEWSSPLKVGKHAFPFVKIPMDAGNRTRLVFRKFNNDTPELVALVEIHQEGFRDINRDLYNAASYFEDETLLKEVDILIRNGANPNIAFEKGRRAIHAAAEVNNVELGRKLLLSNNSIDLNSRDLYGYTPMHIAAENDNFEFITFLLEEGANINIKTYIKNLTPLHIAAYKGLVSIVEALMKSNLTDINAKGAEGFSPFHAAIFGGENVIKKFISDKRTDVNAVSEAKLNAFHLACLNKFFDVADTLHESNATSVNALTLGELTVLHMASISGELNIVKYLASKNKININAESINRWTPLHFSIFINNDLVSLELINQNKTDINKAAQWDVTPLHVAAARGQREVVVALLEKGAAVNMKTKDGHTALHLAVIEGHLEVVAALCDKGADLEAKTNDNRVPLLSALVSHRSNLDVIMYLKCKEAILKEGMDNEHIHLFIRAGSLHLLKLLIKDDKIFKAKNPVGKSLLYSAIENENLGIVQYFAGLGALMDAKSNVTDRSLDFAVAFSSPEVFEYLVREGVNLNSRNDTILKIATHRNNLEMVEFLIENNHYNLTEKVFDGKSLLHIAAESGSFIIVKFLVEKKGVNVDIKTKSNQRPIHFAARRGRLDVLQYLERKGADIIKRDSYNKTPLHYATESCLYDSFDIVQFLVKKYSYVDIHAQTRNNESPIHFAAGCGKLEVIKYLENIGADISVRDTNNKILLHYAVGSGDINTVKYLLNEKGADLLAKTYYGETVLHFAARDGGIDIVRFLVERYHVDLNPATLECQTPLQYAIIGGNLETMKYFEYKGATLNGTDSKNRSFLHYAVRSRNISIVKYLIEKKEANVLAITYKNETVLHFAAEIGDLDIFKYLTDKGADIDAKDTNNKTVLHYAAASGNLQIVKYLIEVKRVNVLSYTNIDETPLHFSARSNNIDVLEYLIQEGTININAETIYFQTPLHYAAASGNKEIFLYLEEKGSNVTPMESFNQTVLHYATRSGSVELVKYLVEKNIFILHSESKFGTPILNARRNGDLKLLHSLLGNTPKESDCDQDCYSETLLHYIAKGGTFFGVFELLDKGALLNFTNPVGMKPVHFAARNGDLDILMYLVFEDRYVSEKSHSGMTPLHYAAEKGRLNVVEFLISVGANVDMKDKFGMTPLDRAARFGKLDTIKLIMDITEESEEKPNSQDDGSLSLLYNGIKGGALDVVKYFVEKGANINAKNGRGATALHLAAACSKIDIVKYLVDKCANINEKDEAGFTPAKYADSITAEFLNSAQVKQINNSSCSIKDTKFTFKTSRRRRSFTNPINPRKNNLDYPKVSYENRNRLPYMNDSSNILYKSQLENSTLTTNLTAPRITREDTNTFKSDTNGSGTVLSVFDSTIFLIHNFIRMFKKHKNKSKEPQCVPESELLSYAVNITRDFENVLNEAALKTNISVDDLNIDFSEVQIFVAKNIKYRNSEGIFRFFKSLIINRISQLKTDGLLKKRFFDTFSKSLELILFQYFKEISGIQFV